MVDATAAVKTNFGKLGQTAKELGGNFANAAKTTFETSRGLGGTLGKVALFPVEMGAKVARWPLAVASSTYKHFPRASIVATGVVAALGVRNWLNGRAEQRTQDEINAQIAGGQNPVQANPYQITPEEAALMEARMRGGNGAPRTGHADSVLAAKQQQAASAGAAPSI